MKITRTEKKAVTARTSVLPCSGYVLLEVIIAFGLFAAVVVSLVKALNMTAQSAMLIRNEMRIERILRSAMADALSNPYVEEGVTVTNLSDLTGDDDSFFAGELETTVEKIELLNEDGQELPDMFRIRVVFYWRDDDGQWHEQSAQTWRYLNLYRS